MSIDRVSTTGQVQSLLAQIQQAQSNLNQTQLQVSSGDVSSTYSGYGDQVGAMEGARAAQAQATSYANATQLAVNQVNLQDTQLTQLSSLSQQLQTAISSALANNDASGLMATAQSVFDSASSILNSTDANGNYIYGGDNDNTPPVNVTSLSQLASLSSPSDAFSNGTQTKSVQIAPGENVNIGVLASNVGAGLMQTLSDIANFNSGSNGNFQTTLSDAQQQFLSSELPTAQTATQAINDVSGVNGDTYSNLQDAVTQQQSMSTMYQGFVSNIQDVDMGQAITNLNQDQTSLEAALQVTAQLNNVSLVNFLPT